MKERIEIIKTNWDNGHFNTVDIDWLFEQAEKVEQLEEEVQLSKKVFGRWMNDAERYEKALKTIKEIGDYYTKKGWALNPDKIEEIINKALED